MSTTPLDHLRAARSRLVEQRRQSFGSLAEAPQYLTAAQPEIIQRQAAIDAIDRAIADEQAGPSSRKTRVS